MWKFAGLDPQIRWFEYDFDKVFATGRDQFGTDEAAETEKPAAASSSKKTGAKPAVQRGISVGA